MSEIALTAPASPLWRTKFRAMGIHLALSAGIFGLLLYLILFHWYPFPFFQVDGGWQGLRLVFGVDMVLGPLLTLIVFNPNKSRRAIALDLAVIAVFQLGALGWGVFTVYGQRPVAAIELAGEFYSAVPALYSSQGVSLDRVRAFSDENPPLIHARDPMTAEERTQSEALTAASGASNGNVALYQRITDNPEDTLRYRRDADELAKKFPDLAPQIRTLEQIHGRTVDEMAIMPLWGRHGRAFLVFSERGDYLGYLIP